PRRLITKVNGEIRRLELPDRSDDRRGTAGKRLGDGAICDTLAPLGDGDRSLFNRVSPRVGELDEAFAGDPRQNVAVEFGSDERVVRAHKEEVHAPELVNAVMLVGVSEEYLLAAIIGGNLLREERRCIVASAFRGAGATLPCSSEFLREPD